MEKYVVACSGGPDSMALLAKMKDQNIIAAHVNYHKRESADRDEHIVRSFCERYEIPFFVLDPGHCESGNFQSWARKVRYDFFVQLAKEHHCDAIFVAHQMDDHMETYLFQICRKMMCEYYGLRPVFSYKGIPIQRPLLGWTKEQCKVYCDKQGIEYGIDESNLEDDYTRNQIRHHILEKMTSSEKEELLKSIQKTNERWGKVQRKTKAFLKGWDRRVQTLPDWYALEEWIYQNTKMRLSKKECIDLFRQIQSDCLIDLRAYDLESHQGKLYIQEKKDPVHIVLDKLVYKEFESFKLCPSGKTIEGLFVDEKDFPLTIRNVQKGDKIELRWGTKKLSRFFIDRKISRIERKNWLVIENSQHLVIFVPGIGCDVQHFSVKPNLFMIQ